MYLHSRKKQDVTAHLKLAYQMNADDANATYQLHFGGRPIMSPNRYFDQRRPTEGELRAWSDLCAEHGDGGCDDHLAIAIYA